MSALSIFWECKPRLRRSSPLFVSGSKGNEAREHTRVSFAGGNFARVHVSLSLLSLRKSCKHSHASISPLAYKWPRCVCGFCFYFGGGGWCWRFHVTPWRLEINSSSSHEEILVVVILRMTDLIVPSISNPETAFLPSFILSSGRETSDSIKGAKMLEFRLNCACLAFSAIFEFTLFPVVCIVSIKLQT